MPKKEVKNINPALIGRKISTHFRILTDDYTGITYVYAKGYHIPLRNDNLLKRFANEHLGLNYKKSLVAEIVEHIKIETSGGMAPELNVPYICVNNGLIDLKNFELIKHTPDTFVTKKLDVKYDPDVDTNTWVEYMGQLTPVPLYVQTLQEYLGYTFTQHQLAKKLLYIYGKGNSGKSTFFNIIMHFLGKRNCSSLDLIQLCQRFFVSGLYGKLANIRSDMDYKLEPATINILKPLTGDDTITVDEKHKVPYQFRSAAKIWLGGNGVPNLPRTGVEDVDIKRWLPIEFPNFFDGGNKDTGIFKKFSTPEMKSIILKCGLDGLKRLQEQNWKFSYDPSVEEIRDWFTGGITKNIAEMFLSEKCVPALDDYEVKGDLFAKYLDWAELRRLPKLPEETFHRQIKNNRIYPVVDSRVTIDDKQYYVWRGVKVE